MSSVRRPRGRLFQIRGPAMPKLLSPKLLCVLLQCINWIGGIEIATVGPSWNVLSGIYGQFDSRFDSNSNHNARFDSYSIRMQTADSQVPISKSVVDVLCVMMLSMRMMNHTCRQTVSSVESLQVLMHCQLCWWSGMKCQMSTTFVGGAVGREFELEAPAVQNVSVEEMR